MADSNTVRQWQAGLRHPTHRGTVAAAGSTYADATPLNYIINRVTAADATKGVKLRPEQTMVLVYNAVALVLKVYPDVGFNIDGGTDTSGAYSMAASQTMLFVRDDGGDWRSMNLTNFGTAGIKADVIAEATAATGVTVDSLAIRDGGLTLYSTGFIKHGVQNRDPSGSTQANAIANAPLLSSFCVIANCDNAKGVALPTAVAGMEVTVKASTAGSTVLVYPQASGAINALSANAAYNTAAAGCVTFIAASTSQWYTIPLAG